MISTGSAITRPASGPEAPMSSRALRERMRPRIEMIAPMVPKGLKRGSGMKNGSEASTLWMRAAM